MKLTISQNTDEFKYMSYTILFFFQTLSKV